MCISSGSIPTSCNPKGKRRKTLPPSSEWGWGEACGEGFSLTLFVSHANPQTNHQGQRPRILSLSAWITNPSCPGVINCPWQFSKIMTFEKSNSQMRNQKWRRGWGCLQHKVGQRMQDDKTANAPNARLSRQSWMFSVLLVILSCMTYGTSVDSKLVYKLNTWLVWALIL